MQHLPPYYSASPLLPVSYPQQHPLPSQLHQKGQHQLLPQQAQPEQLHQQQQEQQRSPPSDHADQAPLTQPQNAHGDGMHAQPQQGQRLPPSQVQRHVHQEQVPAQDQEHQQMEQQEVPRQLQLQQHIQQQQWLDQQQLQPQLPPQRTPPSADQPPLLLAASAAAAPNAGPAWPDLQYSKGPSSTTLPLQGTAIFTPEHDSDYPSNAAPFHAADTAASSLRPGGLWRGGGTLRGGGGGYLRMYAHTAGPPLAAQLLASVVLWGIVAVVVSGGGLPALPAASEATQARVALDAATRMLFLLCLAAGWWRAAGAGVGLTVAAAGTAYSAVVPTAHLLWAEPGLRPLQWSSRRLVLDAVLSAVLLAAGLVHNARQAASGVRRQAADDRMRDLETSQSSDVFSPRPWTSVGPGGGAGVPSALAVAATVSLTLLAADIARALGICMLYEWTPHTPWAARVGLHATAATVSAAMRIARGTVPGAEPVDAAFFTLPLVAAPVFLAHCTGLAMPLADHSVFTALVTLLGAVWARSATRRAAFTGERLPTGPRDLPSSEAGRAATDWSLSFLLATCVDLTQFINAAVAVAAVQIAMPDDQGSPHAPPAGGGLPAVMNSTAVPAAAGAPPMLLWGSIPYWRLGAACVIHALGNACGFRLNAWAMRAQRVPPFAAHVLFSSRLAGWRRDPRVLLPVGGLLAAGCIHYLAVVHLVSEAAG
eukprot:TRINITY_DN6284_c0_g1_i1.p1 TRINITY_DN6284_c0_g1~~TRINITY_DN6284_c0_g1_i1.p1  ORF type:complete len:807 (+),score=125.53 TRINITY_DN6284_c0_g1_i1:298-2421(+)